MALVTTEDHGRVRCLTLNDPQRRNALSLDLNDELIAAIDQAEADDIGALVITGSGKAFCAGADLSQLGASQREGLKQIYAGFLKVANTCLPTVAAVNGAAVGAGMNLALACDLRIASAAAKFDTRFLDLGLHPGGGHTWMMRNIVGPQNTAAMVLFGQILDGEAAKTAGLVWDAVEADQLLPKALDVAARAASGPPELVAKIKSTIQTMGSVTDHAHAVEIELEPQVWSLNQPDFAERLAAIAARISSR